MTARGYLILAAFLTSGAYALDDYNAIFERAVETVDFEFDKNWAYTETLVGDDHVWVGRFDPRRPAGERWQLLTVDDRRPSDDEIEEYRKDKAHEHSDNGDKRVNAMVEPDSVRLIEEADNYWILGFIPEEDQKDFMDSVDATIRVNKLDGHLEYIDIRSHKTIRPTIGVKISRLVTRLTFGPAGDEGPIVPLSTQVDVKGRAYLFISFEEQELYRNSDFEYVGE